MQAQAKVTSGAPSNAQQLPPPKAKSQLQGNQDLPPPPCGPVGGLAATSRIFPKRMSSGLIQSRLVAEVLGIITLLNFTLVHAAR